MSDNKKAIIFLPETGIAQYTKALSVCGQALQSIGYNVYITECTNVCYRCTMEVMSGTLYGQHNPEEKQKSLCSRCRKNLKKIVSYYGFNSLLMSDFLPQNIHEKIQGIIGGNTEAFGNFSYEGVPLGKIAMYSFINETKLLSLNNISDRDREILVNYLYNTLISFISFKNIAVKEKPSVVLTYNPYSQNIAVKEICKNKNILYKNITNQTFCGPDSSLFMISNSFIHEDRYKICQRFTSYNNTVLSADDVEKSFQDSYFRMYGSDSHIFSSSKHADLKKLSDYLGLTDGKRIFCAFTSSLDEYTGSAIMQEAIGEPSAYEAVFDTQIAWLEFLRDFSELHEDSIQIIVKVHPREGLNGGSEHLKLLRKTFAGCSSMKKSFRIIWPEEDVSSYDLLELIDVALIFHSTMGIEASKLGIPVLTYVKNSSYPNGDTAFCFNTSSLKEYNRKLEDIIHYDMDMHAFVLAIRFFYWYTFITSIDLSEDLSRKNVSLLQRLSLNNRAFLASFIMNENEIFAYNINRIQEQNNSPTAEMSAVFSGIEKMIDSFFIPMDNKIIATIYSGMIKFRVFQVIFNKLNIHFYPKKKNAKIYLELIMDKNQLIHTRFKSLLFYNHAYLFNDKNNCIYIRRGRLYTRYSHLIAKYFLLLNQRTSVNA